MVQKEEATKSSEEAKPRLAETAMKTAWLAIFYMCIPSGYALGYVYGGVVGSHTNWRYAFVGEAILMLPFAILGFVMKPLQLKGFFHPESKKALTAVETAVEEVQGTDTYGISNGKDASYSMKKDVRNSTLQKSSKSKVASNIKNEISRFLNDMKMLLVDKVYVVNVLGYIAYNFVIGAYSYWGPKAGYNIYHMNDADTIFGGITIMSGILGTLAGGFLLDYMTNTISNAFKLLSAVTLIGGAFCFGAFCFQNMYVFLALFAIGEILVFATQGPVNYICLHCVKPSMRPLSMAISTVSIHLFGDVPSAPLVGVLQDAINNWRKTALILTAVFFPSALIWFIGIFLHSVDRFNEESEHQITTKTDRYLSFSFPTCFTYQGYIAYNFVIGAYSYWGPKAGYNIYHMNDADTIFGGITIMSGILGTLAGGFLLDYMTNTISNAFKLLSAVTLIGGAFCFGAFCFQNMYVFLALFAIGEILVFATQGPVNYICLHCVKPSMRPLSMAISTVSIHLFGDVPSAPLVGVLQDAINNWRKTALILTAVFFPSALIWFIGIFLHSVDRFNEESEHQITTKTDRSSTTPLLEGKKMETIESVAEP
ncbi:hypothetical protein C1H46_011814 [Malus baccata]|uniref:Major facilitator superfamily (MFS) profile domain-containing protein n=1 Tax=Malus baccata TaxID=106549 RepID=A0A540MW48_MALBA|nr:hypothetical protein C1H46_011814 [Malus baccata]